MNKIIIKSMSIRNFKGIASLDTEFDEHITKIYAENGSGKTTIKNAWEWVLGQNVDNFIPNINGKEILENTSVEIKLNVNDYEYTLKRTNKPKFQSGEKVGNENIYEIDGIEVPAKKYTTQLSGIFTDNAVENIKILTDKEFFNTDTTSWKWTNRRKLLMEMCDVYKATEHIIDDDKYILIRDEIKKGYATSDIKSKYEKERKQAKEQQLKNQALIDQKQSEMNEYLGIDFDATGKELGLLKTKLTKLNNASKQELMTEEIEKLQVRLLNDTDTLSKLKVKKTLERRRFEDIKLDNYNLANNYKHQIEELKANKDVCPVCHNQLSEEQIANTEKTIEELNQKYIETYNTFTGADAKIKELDNDEKEKELENSISQTKQELEELKTKNISKITEFEKTDLERQIFDLERTMARKDDLAKWSKQIQDWKKQNLELADEIVDIETKMRVLQDYVREQTDLVSKTVNDKFSNGVGWSLYDTNLNGTLEEECCCLYNGKRYSSISTGEKNITNLEIVKTLQNYFDVNLPIFSDNCEANTIPYKAEQQVIEFYAKADMTITGLVKIKQI